VPRRVARDASSIGSRPTAVLIRASFSPLRCAHLARLTSCGALIPRVGRGKGKGVNPPAPTASLAAVDDCVNSEEGGNLGFDGGEGLTWAQMRWWSVPHTWTWSARARAGQDAPRPVPLPSPHPGKDSGWLMEWPRRKSPTASEAFRCRRSMNSLAGPVVAQVVGKDRPPRKWFSTELVCDHAGVDVSTVEGGAVELLRGLADRLWNGTHVSSGSIDDTKFSHPWDFRWIQKSLMERRPAERGVRDSKPAQLNPVDGPRSAGPTKSVRGTQVLGANGGLSGSRADHHPCPQRARIVAAAVPGAP
jgi:hypothetical protein